jgi:hypothetical protein
MHNSIIWITVANGILLASYSVRDILWLRILTVIAGSLLIPYYAMQTVPLWPAINWTIVFIVINCYWIVRLIIERRPVHLTADEARLREISFPSLTPREAQGFYRLGAWDDVGPGDSLILHDRDSDRFSVILRGHADVMYRGAKISQLGEGQFIGAIDRSADAVGEIDVLMQTIGRVMCWPRRQLLAFLTQRPDVALALERSVGFELRALLDTTLGELAHFQPSAAHSAAAIDTQ